MTSTFWSILPECHLVFEWSLKTILYYLRLACTKCSGVSFYGSTRQRAPSMSQIIRCGLKVILFLRYIWKNWAYGLNAYIFIFQEENCYEDLKAAIMDKFPEMKSVYLAIPISCFRDIAKTLPCTVEELMQVDQVKQSFLAFLSIYLIDPMWQFLVKVIIFISHVFQNSIVVWVMFLSLDFRSSSISVNLIYVTLFFVYGIDSVAHTLVIVWNILRFLGYNYCPCKTTKYSATTFSALCYILNCACQYPLEAKDLPFKCFCLTNLLESG